MNNSFYILDVFAEKKYAGNQLAVVIARDPLSDNEMQMIAGEFNFSEISFIVSDKSENGGYPVRIFTPKQEVPFAGHPTLGTAYVINKEITKNKSNYINLNLKAGQIPVRFKYEGDMVIKLTMKQNAPEFGKVLGNKEIAEVLSIDPSDIDDNFPIEEVSTGLPFIIAPLRSLSSARKAKINKDAYFSLIEKTDAKAIYLFCKETYDKNNHINARMFADAYGIEEDPATGSAAGCLAGYLVKHACSGKDNLNIRVEQGYEINRPSLLFLEAYEDNKGIHINVGGRVIEVANGSLS